jgi:ribonucleotide monophosphatase NagD (HAD superfamily)
VAKQFKKQTVENSKKLFITDLDGTLLNDQRQISPDDAVALHRMRRQGGAGRLGNRPIRLFPGKANKQL